MSGIASTPSLRIVWLRISLLLCALLLGACETAFTSTPPGSPPGGAPVDAPPASAFVLVDPTTDLPIDGFDPVPQDARFDLSALPTRTPALALRDDPAGAGSVVFALDGERVGVENVAPYALAGDVGGDYRPWSPPLGEHVVTATVHPEANGAGSPGESFELRFSVVDGETEPETPPPPPEPEPEPEPGPEGDVFVAQDGRLVIEVERAPPAGNWTREAALEGFTGDAYYTWRGPNLYNDPGRGVLAYRFRIDEAGRYDFRIRNRHDAADSTLENDAWVRLDGGEWVKAFSSKRGEWTFRTNHEFAHDSKPAAAYELSAGLHTLEISGRSSGFSIDRIHLFLEGRSGLTDASRPESPGESESAPADPPPPPPPPSEGGEVRGELQRWHAVEVAFAGPELREDEPATFLDHRLEVTFTHEASGERVAVPGFFAADGDAAESGAAAGRVWLARFAPPRTGRWNYRASFRRGDDVALSLDPAAGAPAAFDGASGSFEIAESDKSGRDHRARGLLSYVGERYLRFADGSAFLKGGADSPENLLAYRDFDGTYNHGGTDYLKDYAPHVDDWRPGDPTWRGGRGKGLVGALNYLASEGMNSVYFLTMNVEGDGKDVWPWTAHDDRFTYDVSKLEQWEIVFRHMDRLGIQLHVVTQETENDQLLDGGALGRERALYYRELVARFGHHLALVWNLGEENTNTGAQRRAFAERIRALDPYDHPIVVHTYPGQKEAVYADLLGFGALEGPSLQLGDMAGGHAATLEWVRRSEAAGRPWVVTLDEPGNASDGALPDGPGNNHRQARSEALWANLMAGGAGVEWYFGYRHPNDDLDAEDWRSRDRLWDYTRYALEFFAELPFPEMASADELADGEGVHVFAKAGEVYALYLADGRRGGRLDLRGASEEFSVTWFDPRSGRSYGGGTLAGGAWRDLGAPPGDPDLDWAVRVAR